MIKLILFAWRPILAGILIGSAFDWVQAIALIWTLYIVCREFR